MVNYIPNRIPWEKRLTNIVVSLVFLGYGGYGVYKNDLWFPGRRRWSRGIHFTDEPALVLCAAIICGCLVLLSEVVDHYDRRNNERKYKAFANFFLVTAFALFIGALALHLLHKFNAA